MCFGGTGTFTHMTYGYKSIFITMWIIMYTVELLIFILELDVSPTGYLLAQTETCLCWYIQCTSPVSVQCHVTLAGAKKDLLVIP